MDYTKGYTASFYATIVDPVSWTDQERFEIVSGSISRSETDLRQNASLTLRNYNTTSEQWIRIYMTATQNGNSERQALFTGLATSPSRQCDNNVWTINVQCYSVLKPAGDIFLQHGWYIGKNANAISILQRLLEPTGAKVEIAGDIKYMDEDIIAEDGESNISMIDAILDSIDWVMYIRGDGTIVLSPNPDDGVSLPVYVMSEKINPIVESSFSIDYDWFECPNVFRATYGNVTAIARDDDPESIMSVPSRGREIWAEENDVDLEKDETVAEYAKRRLLELQEVSETASYNRRFVPDINVTNKISLNYKNLVGNYIVTSQDITLGHAAVTNEKVKRSL